MKLSRRSFMKANAVAAAAAGRGGRWQRHIAIVKASRGRARGGACRSQRAGRCPRRCWSAGSH